MLGKATVEAYWQDELSKTLSFSQSTEDSPLRLGEIRRGKLRGKMAVVDKVRSSTAKQLRDVFLTSPTLFQQ